MTRILSFSFGQTFLIPYKIAFIFFLSFKKSWRLMRRNQGFVKIWFESIFKSWAHQIGKLGTPKTWMAQIGHPKRQFGVPKIDFGVPNYKKIAARVFGHPKLDFTIRPCVYTYIYHSVTTRFLNIFSMDVLHIFISIEKYCYLLKLSKRKRKSVC